MKCPEHGTPHAHTDGGATCCPDCGDWWSGKRACHCVRCHKTYENVGDFTKHQKLSRGRIVKCDGRGLRLYVPQERPRQLAQE